MSLSIECPSCANSYRLSSDALGKTATCKKCGHRFLVQADASPPNPARAAPSATATDSKQTEPIHVVAELVDAPLSPLPTIAAERVAPKPQPQSSKPNTSSMEAAPTLSDESILQAIQGSIQPVPTTPQYRIALLLVAILMVLLPLIYVGLIGLASWGIYWHAVNNVSIFHVEVKGKGGLMLVLIYAGPIVAGVILILFMIKPLFARAPKREKPRSLFRDEQPLLFTFVDRLCDSVHSPKPVRIDVDCEVNASASLRNGMLSMLGSDLVLTIGLPLVSGLTIRQFSGVLAHEFGHFSQGFGMRMSYVIRTINAWFLRVVYERDAWDVWLQRTANALDIRIGAVLHVARLMVWITRRILWCLMMVGHVVSCYLLRQMEYDADLHECRFSGSSTFEQTSRQLRRLGVAYQQSMVDLQNHLLQGKLGDDLPKMIAINRDEQEAELVLKIEQSSQEEKTAWLTTHPCDRDRIAAAKKENATGVFQLEVPATLLFRHYESLSKQITEETLHSFLEDRFQKQMLIPVDQLLREKTEARNSNKALESYFGQEFKLPRSISFPEWDSKESSTDSLLVERQRIAQMLPTWKAERQVQEKDLDQIDTDWMTCYQVIGLLNLGAQLKPAQFRVPVKNARDTEQEQNKLLAKRNELQSALQTSDAIFIELVGLSIQLLQVPKIAIAYGDTSARDLASADKSIRTLKTLGSWLDSFHEIRNQFVTLSVMLNAIQGNEISQEMLQSLQSVSRSVSQALPPIREALMNQELPIEHADASLNLATYLLPKLPAEDDFGALMEATHTFLEQFQFLYFRCMGTLAHLCSRLDEALENQGKA